MQIFFRPGEGVGSEGLLLSLPGKGGQVIFLVI